MKNQITRFSLHQNAKVISVFIAVTSLFIVIPMFILMLVIAPQTEQQGNFPLAVCFIIPVIYMIFGYISVIIACFVYNFISKFLGGIEFETEDEA